jgi:Matrixin
MKFILYAGFSCLLFIILVIDLEQLSNASSMEKTRTYHKTPSSSSSVHESLRSLGSINNQWNPKENATYSLQFDEQGRQVINVTVIDYAEPVSPRISADNCGEGSNQFTTNNGGVRWMEFPITYAVDPSNSGVSPTFTTNAFIAAFNHFDTRMPAQSFDRITNVDVADIKVRWQFIDGELGQLGSASWTYLPSTLEITSASITLDSGDRWFVAADESCGPNGNSFDIQNVGSHELGHVVGLGHVNDNLLTMFPNSFSGETLKRTLGFGDKNGIAFLYGPAQGEIVSPTAKQSNNIVNTRSYYDITFTTGSGGSIKEIIIDFPSGTAIGVTGLLVESEGIGPGTATKTGPLQITYTVTAPVNIPPGTTIRLELSTIDNPPNTGASYKVTVTTKRPAGTTIDGPTQSTAYKIKQIGTNDITDNSITSSKPAESFMKKVILSDGQNGWNPDGITKLFSIFDTDIPLTGASSSFFNIFAFDSIGATPENHFCDVVRLTPSAQTFTIACSTPPNELDELQYVIENLPPHTP